MASDLTAESIQAGHAIAGATELVPDASGNSATSIEDNGGLPVRVRQASLAPELRDGSGAETGPLEATSNSADAVRSTMSAMQRGWERGRSVAAESPAESASYDAHTPRHRANHEEA